MAHAWNACWVNALGGSNPPSSAKKDPESHKIPGLFSLITRAPWRPAVDHKSGLAAKMCVQPGHVSGFFHFRGFAGRFAGLTRGPGVVITFRAWLAVRER